MLVPFCKLYNRPLALEIVSSDLSKAVTVTVGATYKRTCHDGLHGYIRLWNLPSNSCSGAVMHARMHTTAAAVSALFMQMTGLCACCSSDT